MQSHKKCTKCGVEKPFSDFYVDRSKKSGFMSQCKECHRVGARHSRQRNKEKIKERDQRYREENRVKLNKYKQTWLAENRAKVNEKRRSRYADDPERHLEYRKIWAAKNKEHISEYQRNYRDKNRERLREYDRLLREENMGFFQAKDRKRHETLAALSRQISTVPPRTPWHSHEDTLLLEENGMTIYQKSVALGRSYDSCACRISYLHKQASA